MPDDPMPDPTSAPAKLESREDLRLPGSADERDSAGEKEGLALTRGGEMEELLAFFGPDVRFTFDLSNDVTLTPEQRLEKARELNAALSRRVRELEEENASLRLDAELARQEIDDEQQ